MLRGNKVNATKFIYFTTEQLNASMSMKYLIESNCEHIKRVRQVQRLGDRKILCGMEASTYG